MKKRLSHKPEILLKEGYVNDFHYNNGKKTKKEQVENLKLKGAENIRYCGKTSTFHYEIKEVFV